MNTLKQRLISFFFCVDCRHFTLTGWKCWKCKRRLCFQCAGGWSMYYGWSPGFETCQSCKDAYAKAMDERLAMYMEQYHPHATKKQPALDKPLPSSEYSRCFFVGLDNQIVNANLKSIRQSSKDRWSSDMTTLFNIGNSGSRNIGFFRKRINGQRSFQPPMFQSYFQFYIVGVHLIPLVGSIVVSLWTILEQNRHEIKTSLVILSVYFSLTLLSLLTYLDNPLVIGYNSR